MTSEQAMQLMIAVSRNLGEFVEAEAKRHALDEEALKAVIRMALASADFQSWQRFAEEEALEEHGTRH